jgi:hypothetical protein
MWSRERNALAAERRLAPSLNIEYDRLNSLFTPKHETYRLRVWNSGVDTIDDVWVRLVAASTPSDHYLQGFLPITLRAQHTTGGAPFTLNDCAPLFIDFLECADRLTAQITTRPDAKIILLCHDVRSHHASVEHAGEHQFEVEVQGRNVPTCRKIFRASSTLPAKTPEGASIEITEVSDEQPPVRR